ncbi:hypothetical protein F900_02424 [Acinetobacter modestus]|uniref:Methyltransferase regulatory domain-containing protein n=1 Tax=Acinetobacter modestus TaxID=1776740 RepID=N9NCA6_9GAMM|nr:hypothetical protein F900_02424 [Acinetobacter modestus]
MTTTWTNGYQTEVNYTYGYYRDLSPNFQKFCLLLNGIESPEAQENQTHCELGFGQGVSINIHAANNEALKFSDELLKQNPIFAQRNPNALQKVADLKQQNPNYLIHEYLNQDWQCFSFQQIVRILDEIKLSYAGSTDLSTHLDNINFSEEHQQFLAEIEHPIFKEQCHDYFANTQFRRDLFIRGKNNLTPLQIQERLRNKAFVLLIAKEKLPSNITGLLGTFNLIEDIYHPIGNKFAEKNYHPLTIAELEQSFPELSYAKILNALVIL